MKTKTTKAKKKTTKKAAPKSRFNKLNPWIFVALFALIGVVYVVYSRAATTSLLEIQAESLSNNGYSNIVPLNDAEGDKTMAFWGSKNGATSKFTLKEESSQIDILAKGSDCKGFGILEVKVDGKLIKEIQITSAKLTNYPVKTSIKPGEHTLDLKFTNDVYMPPTCDRNIFVDKISFKKEVVTTPAPTPTPTTSTKLKWPQPALTTPTTINIPTGSATYTASLTTGKDYILKMPASVRGSITISGGRNVVLVGGSINNPNHMTRAVYIVKNTGTVHLEGLKITASPGVEYDAVAINSPGSTVQLQNILAPGVRGSTSKTGSGWHGDIVQPWGGVKALRIDRLTASSNYQGLFLRPDQGAIGSIALSNIDLKYDNVAPNSGGYLVWFTTDTAAKPCDTAPATISEVYVVPKTNGSLGKTVWPDTGDKNCPVTISGSTASWSKIPVTGSIKQGVPANGSFVTETKAGLNYVSPGYN